MPVHLAQYDFGGHTVTYEEEDAERLHFFCGRLKFSRFLHVELTPDEKSESVIRGTVSCLDAFGGAPKQWVYDVPVPIPLGFATHFELQS